MIAHENVSGVAIDLLQTFDLNANSGDAQAGARDPHCDREEHVGTAGEPRCGKADECSKKGENAGEEHCCDSANQSDHGAERAG